jgi:hypothetical protein
MAKPEAEQPKSPSQTLPRVTMSCGDEDYKHLERVERFIKKGRGLLKRIPYAALFKASLRAVSLDEKLLEAYDHVIAQDNRYRRAKPARRAKG